MKPLSKQELFNEAKKTRDSFYDILPESLKISDDQIKKNIDKKYDLYLASFKYAVNKNERSREFSEYESKSDQKRYSPIRDALTNSVNGKDYKGLLNQVNTQEKADHLANKFAEDLMKGNYLELSEVLLNPLEKLGDYLENNASFITKGINMNIIKSSVTINKETRNYIGNNERLFSTLPNYVGDIAQLNATGLGMLSEDVIPNISYEEGMKFEKGLQTMKAPFIVSENRTIEEQIMKDVCTSLGTIGPEDNKHLFDLSEKIIESGIRDFSQYKPENPKRKIADALVKGENLVKRSDEEIKSMEADFNKLEGVVLDQRMKDKEHSNPLTKEEFEKYVQYTKPDLSNDKTFDDLANSYKNIQEADAKKRADQMEAQRKSEQKSIIDNAVKATTEYEKMSGAAKFFSRLLPSSWTQAGRLRNIINETKEYIESHDLTDDFNKALNEAKGIKEEAPKEKQEPEKEPAKTQLDLSEKLNEGLNSSRENFEKERGLEAQKTNEKENSFDDFEIIDESQCK